MDDRVFRPMRPIVIDGEVVRDNFGDVSAPAGGELVFLQTKMNATVAAIRSAFSIAQARVATTPNSLVGGLLAVATMGLSLIGIQSAPTQTKESVASALRTLERTFEERVVAAMPRVYSGELSAERWFNMASPFVTGIRSILDELHESGTSASLFAVFDGMAKDTAEFLARFKAGVEKTFDFMPLIIGGAALLGTYLVVTRLLPQRRLSGYRRRRRVLRVI